MKLKITVMFVVLSAVFLFFVFKGGYFSSNTGAPAKATGQAMTSAQYLEKLKSFSLLDYHGKKLTLDSEQISAGNKIVLHLWASWCSPCVNEVPELVKFAKENSQVKYVIVSLDDNQEDIVKFLKSFPEFDAEPFIRIWDKNHEISKLVNADRLPMTMILTPDKPEPKIINSVTDWKTIKI